MKHWGARHENFLVFDRKGVLHKGRTDMEEMKQKFCERLPGEMSLHEAMKDADVFIGLSVGNVVTPDMLKGMAKNRSSLPWRILIRRSPGKIDPCEEGCDRCDGPE
jgi:malic enzyme